MTESLLLRPTQAPYLFSVWNFWRILIDKRTPNYLLTKIPQFDLYQLKSYTDRAVMEPGILEFKKVSDRLKAGATS